MSYRISFMAMLLCGVGQNVAVTAWGQANQAQHVHKHGHARLAVAVDGLVISVELDTPAEGLYGFEHAAKSDDEKRVVAAANERFTVTPTTLFSVPERYGCKVTGTGLESGGKTSSQSEEVQKSDGTPSIKSDRHASHGDVTARIALRCQKALDGAKATVSLIKYFPRLKTLKVEVLTGKKQVSTTVTDPEQEIEL